MKILESVKSEKGPRRGPGNTFTVKGRVKEKESRRAFSFPNLFEFLIPSYDS